MISGRLVTLRPVRDDDVALIQTWQNEPEVWWLMDYERPFSMRDIADEERRAREEGHPYIIEADGRPVGKIGLNRFRHRDRICGLYVFIGDRRAWGKGYGPDAIFALLGQAFQRLDLHRVELWSLAENPRALRAYERCGFREDARLPERSWKDGRWVDHIIMSVTREDFGAAREAATSEHRR